MPNGPIIPGLLPSIIDRLIDSDSSGTTAAPGYTVEHVLDTVRRDLEELLNTRRTMDEAEESLPEVRRSLLAYGLPDLTTMPIATDRDRADLGRALKDILERFEPRLRDVRVTVKTIGTENFDRTLRFRIDARFRADPAPEVSFDTNLELSTGRYIVKT
ncbi:MAG: type VI secretion system baseplate subunit TssE [Planctomycetia bacterium]